MGEEPVYITYCVSTSSLVFSLSHGGRGIREPKLNPNGAKVTT